MRYSLLFLLLIITITSVAQIRGKVVGVSDGDTFTMLVDGNRQLKIRLHGIDCPEKKQAFGTRAKQFTSDYVYRKEVTVKETDRDRYGRTVGIVYLANGHVLNELLLKEGLAWHYTKYDHNTAWSTYEANARNQRKGLWADKKPIAPWDFRKSKRVELH